MKIDSYINNGWEYVENISNNLDYICKLETIDGEEHLKYRYCDKEGNVIDDMHTISIKELNMLQILLNKAYDNKIETSENKLNK